MKRIIVLALVAAVAAVMAIPAFGATGNVSVDDNFFSPKAKSIKKGSSIKWTWRGDVAHNVVKTSGPGKRFQSPLKVNGTYTKKFRKKGTYKIVCTVHSGMTMTVTVR
jgi:plastocyanin